MFDLRRLRMLRELKHRGSLAAVARALDLDPSTVSQQLSRLERDMGVTLLDAAGRGVVLTSAAETLVAHVEVVLEELDRADADLASTKAALSGVVRVASFQTAVNALILPALSLLAGQHPELVVQVQQLEPEQALPALFTHDLDLVVAERFPAQSKVLRDGLDVESLVEDELRLAVHPRLRRPGPWFGVDALPWIMEPAGSSARRWADHVCQAAGFEPDVRFESADVGLHARMAEEGRYVAFLPDLVWAGRPPAELLSVLPTGPQHRTVITVVRRGSRQHPSVRAVRAALAVVGESLALS